MREAKAHAAGRIRQNLGDYRSEIIRDDKLLDADIC